MASLLVGSVILLTEKVKTKKAAKRDAKREAYEKRYKDLEEEHQKLQRSPSSGSKPESSQTDRDHLTHTSSQELERKSSHDSLPRADDDGPSRWVNEVVLQRTGSQQRTS